MSVCCECCEFSGRGLCDGLITRPGGPTVCGVSECGREASKMRRPWPTKGCCAIGEKKTRKLTPYLHVANKLVRTPMMIIKWQILINTTVINPYEYS
jgi:hypothetical protein